MIVVVTGAGGQVGKSLQKVAVDYVDIDFHFCNSTRLDITDEKAVKKICEELCPDYVINCAAYTAVDKAESEPDQAYLINTTAVASIARACLDVGATLIHYSSDYVYHNDVVRPLQETDPTTPHGVYAKSKLAGEQAIADVGCKAVVIRTSWVYSEFGNNFVKTMLKLGRERSELSIVSDQIGCPTYATDIARATLEVLFGYSLITDHQVTVNYAGAGQISWYEFAEAIFHESGKDMKLQPIPTGDYPTPASRPLWSVMDLSTVDKLFNIQPRPWKVALQECLTEMRSTTA